MREQLNSELKKSIINKDLAATKTIRLIIAAIKDRDIVVRTEGNQNGISEADIISLLKKMQKQREESIQLYTNCLLYTSPSPRDLSTSRMPSSA